MTGQCVTVGIPVLNAGNHVERSFEEALTEACHNIAEILDIDGGSMDAARSVALAFDGLRVLDKPGSIQAAATLESARPA